MLYEKRYLSPRPPPKISLKHDHNWTKGNDQSGSTVEQLVQQSFGEAPRAEFSKPTQSKPNPIRDRSGKPEDTERVFVEKGKTSRSQEIVGKRLQEELGSSDRTGKPEKLSEDIRVEHAHDGTEEPVKSSASTHIVKEQLVPAEHRDIATSNADNEFNRATVEENSDFNIPGVPNSTVKRSHGVNVHNLIQRIENHPQRQALQSDLQQHRAFNPFSKESQDAIKAAGNTELCEIVDVPNVLGRWHSLLHVRTLLARWYNRKQEVHLVRAGSLLYPELLHQEGPATRSQVREERRCSRISYCKSTPKEVSKTRILKHSRSIYS